MKCHHHLAASKSVVYRRKERLKQLFDIEGKSDTALVAVAIRCLIKVSILTRK